METILNENQDAYALQGALHDLRFICREKRILIAQPNELRFHMRCHESKLCFYTGHRCARRKPFAYTCDSNQVHIILYRYLFQKLCVHCVAPAQNSVLFRRCSDAVGRRGIQALQLFLAAEDAFQRGRPKLLAVDVKGPSLYARCDQQYQSVAKACCPAVCIASVYRCSGNRIFQILYRSIQNVSIIFTETTAHAALQNPTRPVCTGEHGAFALKTLWA